MPAPASYFIDRTTAEAAVRYSLPTINAALTDKYVGESGFLYIVVMDPARPPELARFEEAILYEHAVGDREKWDADYAGFARAKTSVAWKQVGTAMSCRSYIPTC